VSVKSQARSPLLATALLLALAGCGSDGDGKAGPLPVQGPGETSEPTGHVYEPTPTPRPTPEGPEPCLPGLEQAVAKTFHSITIERCEGAWAKVVASDEAYTDQPMAWRNDGNWYFRTEWGFACPGELAGEGAPAWVESASNFCGG